MVKTLLTSSIDEAAHILKRGGIVAFPTETVYGLGASVFDVDAVHAVFRAKSRPADNPLIVHVSGIDQIERLTRSISPTAEILISAFFPGPLTLVFESSDLVPDVVSASLDTVAIRMPANATAQSLIRTAGIPLVAPSANLSGRPSPTTWQAVAEDLDGKIDAILMDEPCSIGIESTVVDVSIDPPLILRQGAITLDDVRRFIPSAELTFKNDERVRHSPGTRHRHYSPRANVVIVSKTEPLPLATDAYIGISRREDAPKLSLICENVSEYAAKLFEFFRDCDRRGLDQIACEAIDDHGLGAALMDRIRRASE